MLNLLCFILACMWRTMSALGKGPIGIAILSEDAVLVADSFVDSVLLVNVSTGRTEAYIPLPNCHNDDISKTYPRVIGVSVDSHKRAVFITAHKCHRLYVAVLPNAWQKPDADFIRRASEGHGRSYLVPHGVYPLPQAVDVPELDLKLPSISPDDSRLYVADKDNGRIWFMDLSSFWTSIEEEGQLENLFEPAAKLQLQMFASHKGVVRVGWGHGVGPIPKEFVLWASCSRGIQAYDIRNRTRLPHIGKVNDIPSGFNRGYIFANGDNVLYALGAGGVGKFSLAETAMLRYVQLVAGEEHGGSTQGFLDDCGDAALFGRPHDFAISRNNRRLFLTDCDNHALRVVSLDKDTHGCVSSISYFPENNKEVSSKTCSELGWAVQSGTLSRHPICYKTFNISSTPDKQDAPSFCQLQGARLCTGHELMGGAGAGSCTWIAGQCPGCLAVSPPSCNKSWDNGAHKVYIPGDNVILCTKRHPLLPESGLPNAWTCNGLFLACCGDDGATRKRYLRKVRSRTMQNFGFNQPSLRSGSRLSGDAGSLLELPHLEI